MPSKGKTYQVEPLRTTEEIEAMKKAIKRGNKETPKRPELAERDGLIFLLGINTGLRVNDLVRLQVGDLKDQDVFSIREGKTNKKRDINIRMLQKEMKHYMEEMHSESYLFPSQKGIKPITTTQVYRILDDAANLLGRDDVGTHTMRKTFGYHHYKQFKDVSFLQEIFNHAAPSITKRYIGIRQDEISNSLNDFRLG